jgi:predicted AAA+ superfamily ATPase
MPPYVSRSLTPALNRAAEEFPTAHPPPVVFDEVQHAPGLLSYVEERIEESRDARGRYILTGSLNLLMLEKVTEPLAGRSAWLTLWPLTSRELSGRSECELAWNRTGGEKPDPRLAFDALRERLLAGWYPEPATEPDRDLELWHQSYLRTHVERDVRSIRQIGELTQPSSATDRWRAPSWRTLS